MIDNRPGCRAKNKWPYNPVPLDHKVLQHFFTLRGHDGLRVELETVYRVFSVAHSHDLTVQRGCGDPETCGESCGIKGERVVSCHVAVLITPFEHGICEVEVNP